MLSASDIIELHERVEIIRRVCKNGLIQAQNNEDSNIDIFQHLLDELKYIQNILEKR